MKNLITEEQIQHLNTLDSKKKKRKYLLDCIIGALVPNNTRKISELPAINFPESEYNKFKDSHGNTYYYKKWRMLEDSEKTFLSAVGLISKNGVLAEEKLNFIPTGNHITDSINLAEQSFSLIKKAYAEKERREKVESENTPISFCVKITEDNKECLQSIWSDFHGRLVGVLDDGFLHSNSLFTCCYASNSSIDYGKQIPIVSTEEFLKHIGKEKKGEVIQTSVKGGGVSETIVYKRNFTLGEIADKVVEISLEKMAKTTDSNSLKDEIIDFVEKNKHSEYFNFAIREHVKNLGFINPIYTDKKFTREDMANAFVEGSNLRLKCENGDVPFDEGRYKLEKQKYLDSL